MNVLPRCNLVLEDLSGIRFDMDNDMFAVQAGSNG